MSSEHVYQMIYDHLLEEIRDGKYAIGSRLPTEKELCEQYSVSRITAKRAMDMLAADGFVKRTKGKGTFVIECEPAEAAICTSQVSGTLIAVVIPDFSDAFGTKLLHGIESECAKHGINMVLKLTNGEFETEKKVIEELEALGVQGVLISPVMTSSYNPKLLNLILNHYPLVLLDRFMPGLDASSIGTDNMTMTKNALNYLFELGHEQIAWISPPIIETTPLELRQNAFIDGYIDHNRVPNRDIWYNNIQAVRPGRALPEIIQKDIENLVEHFKAHPEITAVFASEYNVAWLVKRAVQTLGLRVPQDISIICFDLPNSFSQFREFTHIQQDEVNIGKKAVQMLLQRIMDPMTPRQILPFFGIFSVGRSTAKVRTWDVLQNTVQN